MDGASDGYSPTKAIMQHQKIALANDFVGGMFSASSYRMAGSDIANCSNGHAQLSLLKKRMKYSSSTIANLSGDLNGFEPSFAKRLSRCSADGVYNPNGLVDCSPNKSNALSAYNTEVVFTQILSRAGTVLGRDSNNNLNATGNCINTVPPISGNWLWLFSQASGKGDLAFGSADTVIVRSLYWQFPTGSRSGSQSSTMVEGGSFRIGQRLN
jgi:hypothetical protein